MSVYTLALWKVKLGREEEFISAWRDLAAGTKADFPGASAVLLRDRDTPNLFVSSGPWESLEQSQQWRASSTFTEGVRRSVRFWRTLSRTPRTPSSQSIDEVNGQSR
jgi:heme-degrading monooxygenase HmoA